MKKFRLQKTYYKPSYFVSRRFLWFFWIEYRLDKNQPFLIDHHEVYECIRNGCFKFYTIYEYPCSNRNPNIIDYTKYYDSAEDYLNKNSEHII
jgi:hypothetical protein